jgi:hypothetical protein
MHITRTRITATICFAAATLALVAAPSASADKGCVGQIASSVAPLVGVGFGQVISYQARNPEVLGVSNLGEFASLFATAPHDACPSE